MENNSIQPVDGAKKKYTEYIRKDIKMKNAETFRKKMEKAGIRTTDENGRFILTISDIKKLYKSFYRLESVMGWFAICFGVFLLYFVMFNDFDFAELSSYVGLLFCGASCFTGFLLVFPRIRFLRALNKGHFCIERNRVTEIEFVEGDSESPDGYILRFNNSRRFRYVVGTSDIIRSADKGEYYYLIVVKNKVMFVLDEKRYKISYNP